MAVVKPSIAKGTRDFTPREMIRRNYIFNTIRSVFEKYAYLPIETPSVENLSTLMGKYGEEGDRLIFKILNSGDFMQNVDLSLPENQLASKICEKGLRYDLTVPFARFVVMRQNDLAFPFKRYQMQPVWRADRPQKGRYREFYQCDVDVIGSNSLLYEAELMKITDEVFEKLGINVDIKVNNRKILTGFAILAGAEDKVADICTAIDKLDKIGKENVIKELQDRGISSEAIEKLSPIFDLTGDNDTKMRRLRTIFADVPQGVQGVEEVERTLVLAKMYGVKANIELDVLLARGLNYYTGAIFEVCACDVSIGSISGGGRYDDLTGVFGLKNMSGVGISYGAERIYDVMSELDLFPPEIASPVKAIFLNFGEKEMEYTMPLLLKLRENNIASEIYPDPAKIGKQMNYANAKAIPYVIMAGEEEMKTGVFTVKNMKTGEQQQCLSDEIADLLKI
ncbi:MAG: histidine--tRNA ligase [Bacteroidales bacterium]|jgi:histidyl-tRNA synthetase|nr:histidine--tRNA ligase [Bacteroidales bacterium]